MAGKNDQRIEVTEENFGDLLIQGLREAHAVVRGDAEPARRTRRAMTTREADVKPPRSYSGAEIRKIREGLGISQNVFARVLNASPDTVKAWEQGKREPEGMTPGLLRMGSLMIAEPPVLLGRIGSFRTVSMLQTRRRRGRDRRVGRAARGSAARPAIPSPCRSGLRGRRAFGFLSFAAALEPFRRHILDVRGDPALVAGEVLHTPCRPQ